ncbi:hypothetical protein L596_005236 [Steinernema carpocapsae]|uniref:Uncharacterized protein n=1 Tax=Steinernema carpocapsae TaxID=34508 RepID=A0A4U8UYM0_STECR|nr:hypothetical protein L596_005236 [Steinernema carpocapsae]
MIGWPDGVEESDSENEVAPIGDLIPMVEDIMTGKKKPKKNMMKNKQRIFCVGPLEKAPSLAKIKKKEKKKAPKKALSVPKPSANPPTKASKATNPFLNRKFRKRARAPPEPEVVMSVLVPMKGGENDDVPVAPVEKTLAPVDNGSTPSRSTSASRKPRRSCVEMLLSQAVESKIMSEDEVETIVRDARKNRSPGQGSRRSSRSTSANKSRDSSGERPESGRKSRSGRSPTKRLDLETEMDIMIAARDVRRKMTQKTKKPVSEDEADEDEILDEIPPFNEPGYEEYEFDTSMKYEIMEQMWDSFHDYMLVDNFEAVWEKDYLKNAKVPSARQARSSSRGRSKTPRKPRRSSRNAQSDIEDAEGRVTCRHTGTDFEVFKYLNTESFKKMKHNRHERIRRLRMKLEKDMAQNLPANEEHMYSVIESVRSQVMEGWVPDRSLPVIDDESFHYQWTFAKTSRASSGARKGRTPRKQAASAASTPTPTTTPRRGVRQVVSATTTPTPTSKRDRKAAPPVVTPTPEPAVGRQSRPRTRQVRSRQAAAPPLRRLCNSGDSRYGSCHSAG